MSPTVPPDHGDGLDGLSEVSRKAFSETSDPAAYVGRPASDAALDAVDRWLEGGATVGALVSTPGLGKTMLLRVVEARLGERGMASRSAAGRPNALYLPYAGLGPIDLAIWVHGLLGRPAPTITEAGEAVEALARLGEGPDAPFTLLLDDADSMPSETIEAITSMLPTERSSLRLLLALNPDSKGSRLVAALHALAPQEIRYRERLSPVETRAYVRARMRWAGFAAAEIDRVDDEESRRIHALSNGIPRAIHAVAADRLQAGSAIGGAEGLGAKRRREDWMGRPIEDDLEL